MAAPRSTHGAASAPGQGLRLPQPPTPASPLAAAAAPSPEALAQDAGDAVVAPANITVVTTPGELQAASLAGAQDIEIRSHLDLRSLKLAENPAITGNETENNPKRLALLYASPPLRSIRGNCAVSDPVEALELTPDVAADLLPLKPRQCLVVVSQTWLMINSGHLWVDNVYLKLSRRLARPNFAFVTAGALTAQYTWPNIVRSTTFLTGITFHGEHRGNARGVVTDITAAAVAVDDCIFTDWAGFNSPLTIKFQSVVSVRNTIFRNMNLHVEIADVSFEGIVHFEDVQLANVTLQHGAVVSTTLNDYQQAIGFYITYYADDDADYDVLVSKVPAGDRGVFQEDFVVTNDTMSDCLYLLTPTATTLPGCGENTLTARNRTIDRGGDLGGTGVPFSATAEGPAGDYYYMSAPWPAGMYSGFFDYKGAPLPAAADYTGHHSYQDYDTYEEYKIISDPTLRTEMLLPRADDPWLAAMRRALPPIALAPGWPLFTLATTAHTPRRSLEPEPVIRSDAVAAAILGPLDINGAPPTPVQAPGGTGVSSAKARVDVTAVLLIVAIEVLVAAALTWLWAVKGQQYMRCLSGARRRHRKARAVTTGTSDGKQAEAVQCAHRQDTPAGRDTGRARQTSALAAAPASQQPANRLSHEERLHSGIQPFESCDDSVVSRGVDVPPLSVMNSAYNYDLPPRLALIDGSYPADTSPTRSSAFMHLYAAPIKRTEDSQLGSNTVLPLNAITGAELITGAGGSSTQQGGDSNTVCTTSGLIETQTEIQGTRKACLDATTSEHNAYRSDVRRRIVEKAIRTQSVSRLLQQLDTFSNKDLFLGRFEMMGRQHRRRGGQAVVQFALGVLDRCEYAVKFFLEQDAFLTEAALYAACFPAVRSTVSEAVADRADSAARVGAHASVPVADAVSRFLPQVEAVCDGFAAGLTDPRGHLLPPCIVMEKGESLQDLCDRAQPDLFTALAVLSNVAQRLADMHDAGYVHRDVKPANVMWLPRQNRWTLIDFGCVARLGAEAPVNFTLAYAAPEVAVACRCRHMRIEARAELDAWSLGVMAFELLTGSPAFDLLTYGRSKVIAMLVGEEELPWEGELSTDVKHGLGAFKGPVLQLLQRDISQRSSMKTFHAACTRLFASKTS